MSITLAEPLEKWVREQSVQKLVKILEESQASGFEAWTATSLEQSKQLLKLRRMKVQCSDQPTNE
jgi:hypothetical protein